MKEKRALLAYKREPFILYSANHLQANPEMELKLKAAVRLYLVILILVILPSLNHRELRQTFKVKNQRGKGLIIEKVAKLLRSDATATETRQICIFNVKICSHSARSARAVVNLVQGSFSIDDVNRNGRQCHKSRIDWSIEEKQACCTCGTRLRTSSCRPLQNNNVKLPHWHLPFWAGLFDSRLTLT